MCLYTYQEEFFFSPKSILFPMDDILKQQARAKTQKYKKLDEHNDKNLERMGKIKRYKQYHLIGGLKMRLVEPPWICRFRSKTNRTTETQGWKGL